MRRRRRTTSRGWARATRRCPRPPTRIGARGASCDPPAPGRAPDVARTAPVGKSAGMPQRTLRGGVDLGGTKIQTVVVDDDQQVLGQARRPTPAQGGPADVVAAIEEAVREAAEQGGV